MKAAQSLPLADALLNAWHTSNRVTLYLIEHLPDELWNQNVPGYPRKTVQMLGGHLHNCRCMWIKTAGKPFEVEPPEAVDRYSVSRGELAEALGCSAQSIEELLRRALERGGTLPGFSLDAVHFMNYLVAHEAHHRGQIVLAARLTGHRLPDEVLYGLWQWSKRAREA